MKQKFRSVQSVQFNIVSYDYVVIYFGLPGASKPDYMKLIDHNVEVIYDKIMHVRKFLKKCTV
jgi:hypothetical protein